MVGIASIEPPRVLAQATRARLIRLLRELGRPAATRELAAQLTLHPNGVRVHLEMLEREGLVARVRERRARGRPRDVWSVTSDGKGEAAPDPYRDLACWLSRALAAGARADRSIEAAGRTIGRELAPSGARRFEHALVGSLAALGFDPHASRHPARLRLELGNCPYRAAAQENQAAICALHRGITRGLLDVLGEHVRLARFEPRDPARAGCVIELTRLPAAEAGDPAEPCARPGARPGARASTRGPAPRAAQANERS